MAICVDREKCIGCESCIAVCPVGALNMVDGKANIDQDTCIACGACIGECPVEAIGREEIVREVKPVLILFMLSADLSMQSIILIFILMLFVNWLKPINQMLFYAELLQMDEILLLVSPHV